MAETLPDNLMTTKQLAEYLSLKPQTLRLWICQRKIPFFKIGGSVRFRRSEIEALLEQGHVGVATFYGLPQQAAHKRPEPSEGKVSAI
jgi:excisionase family DNA binding protein